MINKRDSSGERMRKWSTRSGSEIGALVVILVDLKEIVLLTVRKLSVIGTVDE